MFRKTLLMLAAAASLTAVAQTAGDYRMVQADCHEFCDYEPIARDVHRQITYTYDEYGFVRTRLEPDKQLSTTTYTWLLPGEIWTEKKTVTKDLVTGIEKTDRDVRELDADNRVLKRTLWNTTDDGEITYVGQIIEYDEDGLYTCLKTRSRPSDEYTVMYARKMDDGRRVTYTDYTYKKVTFESTGLSYVVTTYYPESDEIEWAGHAWYDLAKHQWVSTSLGYLNGRISDLFFADGFSNICKECKYADGFYEYKSYAVDKDYTSPKLFSRQIFSENYYDPDEYVAGEVRTLQTWSIDSEGNEYGPTTTTRTWLNESPLIRKTAYSDDRKPYYNLLENNTVEYVYFDEDNGIYTRVERDGELRANVLTYYKTDGTVVKKLRDYGIIFPYWEEWTGTDWVGCKNGTYIWHEGADKKEATFNELGQMLTLKSDFNISSGIFNRIVEYEYTPAGYNISWYNINADGQRRLFITYEDVTLQGNDLVYLFTNHSGGWSHLHVIDRVTGAEYSYRPQDGEFEYASQHQETIDLGNGRVATDTYTYTQDRRRMNLWRSITEAAEGITESHEWNDEKQQYVPVSFTQHLNITGEPFYMLWPADPRQADEYYFEEILNRSVSTYRDIHLSGTWDAVLNDWVWEPGGVKTEAFSDGNTHCERRYRVDADGKLQESKPSVIQRDEQGRYLQSRYAAFTYDSNGNLASWCSFMSLPEDAPTWCQRYSRYDLTYAKKSELQGAEDTFADADSELLLQGRTLSYMGDGTVTVYTAGGRKVGNVVMHSPLLLPAAGLYLVSTPAGARKLAVR